MPATDPSRALRDAFAELLTDTGYDDIFKGRVTKADADLTYPHLIVWTPPVHHGGDNLEPATTEHSGTVQVTAVGRDEEEVLAALDRAALALVNRRLPIPGRDSAPIRQVPLSRPVQQSQQLRTRDGQPTSYYGIALFNTFFGPATA